LRLLYEIKAISESDFNNDKHRQSSVKYNFIVAIEAAIDVANHLISKQGFRAPEDYADTFRILADNNIIEADFALELEKMARFRNRLVHIYWDIDTKEIWNILQTRLEDFEKYISKIGTYIASGE
jgi:uncharacterized protein YutE (UPF0331/DUF86 family)